jgi:Tol biopolymer transport system component
MLIRIIVATCALLLSSLFAMQSSQIAWAGPDDNTASDSDPSWSPDGTKIAFSRVENDGYSSIYVMNATDGSGVTRLTVNSNASAEKPAAP